MKQNEHTLEQICADLCSREQKRGSIGLLGEKVLHAGLKFYFEPNSDFHEVKVNGLFIPLRIPNTYAGWTKRQVL